MGELDVEKFGQVYQKSKDTLVVFYRGTSQSSIKLNPYFERLAADIKKRSKHVQFFRVDEGQQGFPAKGTWPGLEKASPSEPTMSGSSKDIAVFRSSSDIPSVFYVNASSPEGRMLP